MDPVAFALLQRYPLPTRLGNGEQLQPDRERNAGSGPVGRAPRSQIRLEPRLGLRPAIVLPRRLRAGDAASGRQRCDDGNARTAGHDRLVLRVELPALVLVQRAERTADRRHAAQGRQERRAVVGVGGGGPQHSGHTFHRQIPRHLADVSDQRLHAIGIAAQHRIRLQYRRVGGGRRLDLVERPAHVQDGVRLALGASERRPASIPDWIVHLQCARQRSAGHRQHGNSVRQFSARPGAAVLD